MSSNGECTNDMVPHMDDRARLVQLSEQDLPIPGAVRYGRFRPGSLDIGGPFRPVLGTFRL